ncbi:hypothetical protein EPN15_05050 [Patescibacteria group bacterium]|nr:MAG: hypothetical protein EPN15_05050 [Patescibacteria group bacterium]
MVLECLREISKNAAGRLAKSEWRPACRRQECAYLVDKKRFDECARPPMPFNLDPNIFIR